MGVCWESCPTSCGPWSHSPLPTAIAQHPGQEGGTLHAGAAPPLPCRPCQSLETLNPEALEGGWSERPVSGVMGPCGLYTLDTRRPLA